MHIRWHHARPVLLLLKWCSSEFVHYFGISITHLHGHAAIYLSATVGEQCSISSASEFAFTEVCFESILWECEVRIWNILTSQLCQLQIIGLDTTILFYIACTEELGLESLIHSQVTDLKLLEVRMVTPNQFPSLASRVYITRSQCYAFDFLVSFLKLIGENAELTILCTTKHMPVTLSYKADFK